MTSTTPSLYRRLAALALLLVALVSPRAAVAQTSLCSKGATVEVQIDGRWWPGVVADAPRATECAVTHHAYFGTENTSWVPFAELRSAGTDPSTTGARPTSPLCVAGTTIEITVNGHVVPATVVRPHPSDGTCLVTHRANAGVEMDQWMTSSSMYARGTAPVPAAPPQTAPADPAKPPVARKPGPRTPMPVPPPVQRQPAALPVPPVGPSRELEAGIYVLVDGLGNLHYRTFLPGRYIFSGIPAGGLDVFSLVAARTGDPRDLGGYALTGGTLTITWGDTRVETKTFAPKGSELALDGYVYRALVPYPGGHRLDGRYTTRVYNSMGVAGGGSMAWGGASTVIFHANGTFEAAQAGTASSTAGYGAAGSGSSKLTGRYAITGNTITFTLADGTVQRSIIHPWKGEERASRPTSLNLNGHTYTLEK